ncbi:MAG: aspartate/glutamate racemase family protein [Firmicutes bacterium]|nr:aspartate/glutamate racemase family protein [Bacillota bacterium]
MGIAVPARNTTLEPDAYALLPEWVTAHFSRMPGDPESASTGDPSNLRGMFDDIPRVCLELSLARVDAIGFGCTAGSFIGGSSYDDKIRGVMGGLVDVPVATTAEAVIQAMRHLGMARVVVVSPYSEESNNCLRSFLVEKELEVVELRRCPKPEGVPTLAEMDPALVRRAAMHALPAGTDGLFISCTNLPVIRMIGDLERDLGKPVVSSNQALIWYLLRLCGKNLAGREETSLWL